MFVIVLFRTIFASAFVRLGKKLSQIGSNGVGNMSRKQILFAKYSKTRKCFGLESKFSLPVCFTSLETRVETILTSFTEYDLFKKFPSNKKCSKCSNCRGNG